MFEGQYMEHKTENSNQNESQQAWRKNLGQSRINLVGARNQSWWTGITPSACPGFKKGGLHALPQVQTTASRSEIKDYFNNGWTLTELLFSALEGEEAFYRPPLHGLRHPLVFYYAHPAVLYVNKLRLAGLVDGPVNPEFEALFEVGVDEMSWDDLSKNEMSWPPIESIKAYRQQVYNIVSSLIDHHPDLGNKKCIVNQSHPLWALFMGFEHERIHIETSAVLMRELPLSLVRKPEAWPQSAPSQSGEWNSHLIPLSAATVEIGKPYDEHSFGWDNEYGSRKIQLGQKIEVRAQLVSNAEYLNFVADSGYQKEEFWTATGWKWRSFRNIKHPTFWVPGGPQGLQEYRLRTTFEVIDMESDWPAIVNFHEAEAYAKWLSHKTFSADSNMHFRLLSEVEQLQLRKSSKTTNFNHNLRYGTESSVAGDGSDSVQDVFGNVWQWCADHFNPLPGFKVHKYYDDFSTPCFDAEHQMILGGSFMSAGGEATPSARFHFRPHFLQNAGIRLAKSPVDYDGGKIDLLRAKPGQTEKSKSTNPYESDQLLRDYLVLHFGAPKDQMPYEFGPTNSTQFPQRCAQLVIDAARELNLPLKNILDVGCAVGGSTFALAERSSAFTIGVDLSGSFINAALELKKNGSIRYKQSEEGDITSWREARVESVIAREKTDFRRADACALPPDFVDFDAVLMANLLCRVPSPMSVLQRMSGARGVVRRGGLLVMTTPFSWLPEYTPREVWLGGFEQDGKEQWSSDVFLRIMEKEFILLKKDAIPLVIREHKRKFQYIVADSYVFQRR
jgi:5-histidylcysteine sulfoxide synthase/putative 4-mercaptohistidine N1-methyltranferase